MLLLMDGHSSHYCPETIRLAQQQDVILFMLQPHTTHEMQPLDTSVFSSLKTHWQDICHDYLQQHPGCVITKYQFSGLFSEAWGKALVPISIISGFKCTGVYPFNPQVVLEKCPPSGTPSETVTDYSESRGGENDNGSSGEEEDGLDFTTKEEKKFQR